MTNEDEILRLECLRLASGVSPDAGTMVTEAQKLYDFCKAGAP